MRRSRNFRDVFVAVALVIGLAVTTGVNAAERFDRLVPSDVTQFMTVRSYQRLKSELEESPYGGLGDEPEVQKFMGQIHNKISGDLSKFEKVTGMKPQALENFFHGQVAFAMKQEVAQSGGQAPEVTVLLLSDLGPNTQKAKALLQGMKVKAKTDARFSVTEENIAGHAVDHFVVKKKDVSKQKKDEKLNPELQDRLEEMAEGESVHVFSSIENGVFALSAGKKGEMMKAYFERRDGTKTESLADMELYQNLRKRVNSDSLYVGFQNYNSMWDNMKRRFQNMTGKVKVGDILDELGLTALEGQISEGRFTRDGIVGESFLRAAKPRKGIIKSLVPQQNVDVSPPDFVGSDTALYLGGHFSVNVLWAEAMRVVKKFSPGTHQMLRMQMENPQAPFNPEKGLIQALGDRWFVSIPKKVVAGEQSQFIDALIAVDLQKPDMLRGTIEKIMEMPQMQGKILVEEVEGTAMYKMPPAPVFSGMEVDAPPLHVALAIMQDRLYIGMSPQTLRGVITGEDHKRLKSARKYQAIMRHVQKRRNSLLYMDQRVVGRWLVDAMRGALKEEGLDLPSYRTMQKYLSISASTSRWTGKGLQMKTWMEYPEGDQGR